MSVRDAFGAVCDWVLDPNDSMPMMLFKVGTVTATILGTLAAPFIIVAHLQSKALEKDFAELDANPTVIFNGGAAGCIEKQYGVAQCGRNQKRVDKIAGALGTSLSYSSSFDCANHHANTCVEQVIPRSVYRNQTTYDQDGKPTTISVFSHMEYDYYYNPRVIAWQALKEDGTLAVPLYATPDKDSAVRKDGLILKLQ